ncbi:type II toxin-antitoxin system VapC family toxin [Trabulsiella odontotermitis]|uniref:type II toxin-antitoxin system VapC family toxin n=1 Tax=Trabulsiella odontotermitis TaxID=379893 RepID=UPI0024B6FD0D|nr:type II toxin-antitoxin system VapC family toxin [Trabulsiella odontotermitis]WHP31310.1 type II toxin-antitoxin system VapC family toxin [Trabulsiella odontotermitis]
MSGSALFDTNILIDLFSGRQAAIAALEAYPSQRAISLITWIEVMVGVPKYGDEERTKAVLELFDIIDINRDIAAKSIELRRTHGMRLPDALILATAQVNNRSLVTRNTKDFAGIPGVVTPYQL